MFPGHVSAHRHVVAGRDRRRDIRGPHGRHFTVSTMKTVTITEAKRHLGAYLKEAATGSNIGIICGNRIVALRPVTVTSIDFDESGDPDVAKLTPEQRDLLYARLKRERKEAKRRRKELLTEKAGG